MIEASEVIKARDAGEMRYSLVTDYSGNLNRVLGKFGLIGSADHLQEYDRNAVLAILACLLSKDMAYHSPCMSEADAREMAEWIVSQYECTTSKFYSNGNWADSDGVSWNPLTDSTFDGGIIITGADHRFFCLWFQDED